MEFPIPRTRNQWTAAVLIGGLVLAFLYFCTPLFSGHAVEVSVHNATAAEVFVNIDNTGRHGPDTAVTTLNTTSNSMTPPGIRINPGTTKSFGMAVGLFDSPTLHVWPITKAGLADAAQVNDCPFDTVPFLKWELPSTHVKLQWNGNTCDRL